MADAFNDGRLRIAVKEWSRNILSISNAQIKVQLVARTGPCRIAKIFRGRSLFGIYYALIVLTGIVRTIKHFQEWRHYEIGSLK